MWKKFGLMLFLTGIVVTGKGQSFEIPNEWTDDFELEWYRSSGSNQGIERIKFKKNYCNYRESRQGQLLEFPFKWSEKDQNALLIFLKEKRFNHIKINKIKQVKTDSPSDYIICRYKGQQYTIGNDNLQKVHPRDLKRYQSIQLHLYNLAHRYLEPLKVNCTIPFSDELINQLTEIELEFVVNNMQLKWKSGEIPGHFSVQLFPGTYLIHVKYRLKNQVDLNLKSKSFSIEINANKGIGIKFSDNEVLFE
ncbi:MAG: hypothetical protein K1X56_03765 [Flavobacteriales bacterium]|nr:hypothetical protein [Flavobacteriales bacterium]